MLTYIVLSSFSFVNPLSIPNVQFGQLHKWCTYNVQVLALGFYSDHLNLTWESTHKAKEICRSFRLKSGVGHTFWLPYSWNCPIEELTYMNILYLPFKIKTKKIINFTTKHTTNPDKIMIFCYFWVIISWRSVQRTRLWVVVICACIFLPGPRLFPSSKPIMSRPWLSDPQSFLLTIECVHNLSCENITRTAFP